MQIFWRTFSLFIIVLVLSACGSSSIDIEEVRAELAALPEGSAERGEALFAESINGMPSCISCHALGDDRDGLAGPPMGGYPERAGSTIEEQNAELYTYTATVYPASHIVSGYGNLMYTEYGSRLNDQQIADLIAYMLNPTGDA